MDVHVFDSEAGHYISAEHQRIAELIHDYDPTLELAWIPPSDRAGETHPFAIIHRPVGKQHYIVRTLKDSEVNAELVAWLWANDQERNNPLAMLEKWDQANEALRLKKQMEEQEEANDIASSILSSHLNTYKHNGKVYR